VTSLDLVLLRANAEHGGDLWQCQRAVGERQLWQAHASFLLFAEEARRIQHQMGLWGIAVAELEWEFQVARW
jgi:hypothetical protein